MYHVYLFGWIANFSQSVCPTKDKHQLTGQQTRLPENTLSIIHQRGFYLRQYVVTPLTL
jgi:hypothetical protein